MLGKVTRYLTGYVKVKVEGEGKFALLNACVKNKIYFIDYKKDGDKLILRLKLSDYEAFQKVSKRYQVKVERLENHGLPFLMAPYFKRQGLLLGALFAFILCFVMSGRVWVIESEGSSLYKENEVLKILSDMGLEEGVKQSEINPHKLKQKLLLYMDGVDFVTLNTDGVSVKVIIKDSIRKPAIYNENNKIISNLVAIEDGVIKHIEALGGMKKVKVNEAVKKGDLLISGLWDTYDSWGNKTGKSFKMRARGKVLAEVINNLEYEVQLKGEKYEKGSEVKALSLSFFGIKIPMNFPLFHKTEYKKEVTEIPLYIAGVKMPVKTVETLYTETFKTNFELTEKEGEAILKNRFLIDLREKTENGEELLSYELSYRKEGDRLYLKAECKFLKEIGKEEIIMME